MGWWGWHRMVEPVKHPCFRGCWGGPVPLCMSPAICLKGLNSCLQPGPSQAVSFRPQWFWPCLNWRLCSSVVTPVDTSSCFDTCGISVLRVFPCLPSVKIIFLQKKKFRWSKQHPHIIRISLQRSTFLGWKPHVKVKGLLSFLFC